MWNPVNTLRRIQTRLGKPIRPIIEFQKGGSVININTKTIDEGNVISDPMQVEVWEKRTDVRAIAIYVDGIFKGMGYAAGEEGVVLEIEKKVALEKEIEIVDKDNPDGPKKKIRVPVISISYKGLFGKAIDAKLIEIGSALKPSMMQTLIYCFLVGLSAFMMGMVWK